MSSRLPSKKSRPASEPLAAQCNSFSNCRDSSLPENRCPITSQANGDSVTPGPSPTGKGKLRQRVRQYIMSLAKRNLTDGCQECAIARQPQFVVQKPVGERGLKLLSVHAVVKQVRLVVCQTLGDMELSCCRGDGQEAVVAVKVGDGLPADRDDIAEMRDARYFKFRRHRPGKPAHRQAVGVEQVRTMCRRISASRRRRWSIASRPPLASLDSKGMTSTPRARSASASGPLAVAAT